MFTRFFKLCVPNVNDVISTTSSATAIPAWDDTIPFVPPVTEGICIKAYDGDTITIAAKLPYPESPLYRFQVRLNGIDCPDVAR